MAYKKKKISVNDSFEKTIKLRHALPGNRTSSRKFLIFFFSSYSSCHEKATDALYIKRIHTRLGVVFNTSFTVQFYSLLL